MSYNANSMRAMEGIEHVRYAPSMYLTDAGNIGIFQALKEIVTNSVDEALNGHGNEIVVTLSKDNRVSVRDNGRGIPPDVNTIHGKTGIDMAVAVLNAGGKYDKSSYASSGGMYGVGASATNAISEDFTVEVRRGGKIHSIRYEKGIKVSPAEADRTNIIGTVNEKDTGTKVIFKPDFSIMTSATGYDEEIIKTYLKQLSYLCPKISFIFIDERVEADVKTFNYYSKNGISDFMLELTSGYKVLHKELLEIKGVTLPTGDTMDLVFQYIDDMKTHEHLYVNKNSIPNGGTAITGFKMGLAKAINETAKLLGMLKEKDKPFKSADLEEGLVCVMSLGMAKAELEGQSKHKLTTVAVQSPISNVCYNYLVEYLEANPNTLGKIVEKALIRRKALAAAMSIRNNLANSAVERGATSSKLKDCMSKNPSERELYLVEGASAAGNMPYARNANTQAYYELRGKVLNVENVEERMDVFKNEIFKDLNNVLGCGVGENFDISKLRYGKIIVLTDADHDGMHIASLLLTCFYRLYKELITNGHIYLAVPPLFRVKWGKDGEVYLKDNAALDEWTKTEGKNKKYDIYRFKGLGEMNPEHLELVVSPDTRTLIQVRIEDDVITEETIQKLMRKGNAEFRRKFYESEGREL